MLLLISILIAFSFWVFIFLFFIKRADNFIKKFNDEVKYDIEKSKKDIQLIISQAVEKGVNSLVTAEQEIVPQLEDAKDRIKSSEKKLAELLFRIKIRGVVKEELEKIIKEDLVGKFLPPIEHSLKILTSEVEKIAESTNRLSEIQKEKK